MLLQNYITAKVAQFPQPVDAAIINMAYQLAGAKQSDEATDKNRALVVMYLWLELLPFLPKQVTEGGYSISWNVDFAEKQIGLLAGMAGMVSPLTANSAPTVTDKSFLW